jgi:predicted TIM-barrel fold metal-dependent hydrolase
MRTLLLNDALDALWGAADANGLPVMLYAPDGAGKIARIAGRHPGLRLVVDHMGLAPFVQHDDLGPAVRRLEPLAAHPNVAVKGSSIPSSVAGPYPFRAAHEPLRRVVGAFGAHRVFWGSDLTRLPCSYGECVTMFTEELDFLTDDDRRLIMGRAICDWLGWPVEPVD